MTQQSPSIIHPTNSSKLSAMEPITSEHLQDWQIELAFLLPKLNESRNDITANFPKSKPGKTTYAHVSALTAMCKMYSDTGSISSIVLREQSIIKLLLRCLNLPLDALSIEAIVICRSTSPTLPFCFKFMTASLDSIRSPFETQLSRESFRNVLSRFHTMILS